MLTRRLQTRLCVVRHGETDWNAGRRIQGQTDVPLSVRGHAQARATANALAPEGFAALYSSDLIRARQTAEATAHLIHLPVQQLTGLRERHCGTFQGLTYAEMAERDPDGHARYRARDPHFAPAGGESLHALARRIEATFDTLVERHPGKSVAVFTHGGVLDILYRRVSRQPLDTPRDFTIPNCGINWIEVFQGQWTLLGWAERDHLDASRDEL